MAPLETLVMEVCRILEFWLFSKICGKLSFFPHVHGNRCGQCLSDEELPRTTQDDRLDVQTATSPQRNVAVSCLHGVRSPLMIILSITRLSHCCNTPQTSPWSFMSSMVWTAHSTSPQRNAAVSSPCAAMLSPLILPITHVSQVSQLTHKSSVFLHIMNRPRSPHHLRELLPPVPHVP